MPASLRALTASMALALGAACAPPMPMFEQLDASEASVSRPDVVAMDRFTSALDASDDRSMTSARDVNVIADDAAPACDGDASACPTRANAAARCVGNRCAYECLGSYADCNNEPRDGCELDTASSVNNCGACGVSCPAANNATATCTAGACLFTCSSGFADCDRDRSNGCEADTSRSPDNCGTCATRCSAAANATATCSSGTCAIGCAAGFANCDGNNGNGCEQRTSDDADHCGMCGNRCPAAANATARCAMGACGIVCAAGFANCDGSSSNGCEATLASDVSHCGACGNRCSAGINSVASCRMGVCSSQCSPGFADCDGNDLNGCEVDTRTTLAHCGMCGAVCTSARPGTTPVCTMGMCRAVCSTGFFDCDGDATNGCEIDTRSSAMNCGACGTVCPMRPNSVALCSSSMCSSRCVAGFSDCDGNSANGCETAAPSCP